MSEVLIDDEFDLIDLDDDSGLLEIDELYVTAFINRDLVRSLINKASDNFPALVVSEWGYKDAGLAFKEQPDVVVFECRIIEAIDDLKMLRNARKVLPYTPIVAISGNPDPEFKLAFYQAGVTLYYEELENHELFNSQLNALKYVTKECRLLEIERNILADKLDKLDKLEK